MWTGAGEVFCRTITVGNEYLQAIDLSLLPDDSLHKL